MIRFKFSSILTLFILSGSSADAIEVGALLPAEVKIEAAQSEHKIDLQSSKGKVSILNFWATWCAACKVEIKEMEDAFAELMNNDHFQLAFVSLDKDPEMAIKWMRENTKGGDAMLPRLFKDPSFAAAERLDVDSFPMTVVLGPDGKIAHIQRGFEEGKGMTEKMVTLAESLLKGG